MRKMNDDSAFIDAFLVFVADTGVSVATIGCMLFVSILIGIKQSCLWSSDQN